jgi:hypothetical protein
LLQFENHRVQRQVDFVRFRIRIRQDLVVFGQRGHIVQALLGQGGLVGNAPVVVFPEMKAVRLQVFADGEIAISGYCLFFVGLRK